MGGFGVKWGYRIMGVIYVCTKASVVDVVTSGNWCDSQKQRGMRIVSDFEIGWLDGECS